MSETDGLRPETFILGDEQRRRVAGQVRRHRIRCGGCGGRRFDIGLALHLGFLFVSEEPGEYLVALTCKNASCPAPHAGIRLHGPELKVSHRTRHPEELPNTLAGRQVLDSSEEAVGHLLTVHAGADGGLWGAVRTGRLRGHVRFVPLQQASMDGEHVVVPIDGATIRHAPPLPDGALSPEDERRLLEHYHLGPVVGS